MGPSNNPLSGAFRIWWRTALIYAICFFLIVLVRPLLDGALIETLKFRLLTILFYVTALAAFVALLSAVPAYFRLRNLQPVLAVLGEMDENAPPARAAAFTGFIAMEYYALIWNRTFAVFIGSDGVYGWRVCGGVTSGDPEYFKGWAEMLDDPSLMQNAAAVRKLSQLPGGFFIPRATIVEVIASEKQKWGLSRIAHSGRVTVHTTDGRSRELILLGSAIPNEIRDQILGTKTTAAS